MTTISEFELLGQEFKINKKEDGTYDVFVNGDNKQPNHDAEGIIRYLSNALFNSGYLYEKVKKENEELKKSNKVS